MPHLLNGRELIFNQNETVKDIKIANSKSILFAVPMIAFLIESKQKEIPENIFELSIIGLKKLGKNKVEIADMLCLDKKLVANVIDFYKESSKNNDTYSIEKPIETQIAIQAYIFYNCLTESFLPNFMPKNRFDKCIPSFVKPLDNSVEFSSSIGSGNSNAHILNFPNISINEEVTPSENDMIKVAFGRNTKNKNTYSYVNYLNYSRKIYVVCEAFYNKDNLSDYQIANPVYGKGNTSQLKEVFSDAVAKHKDQNNELYQDFLDLLNEIKNVEETLEETSDKIEQRARIELVDKFGTEISKYPGVLMTLTLMNKYFIIGQNKNDNSNENAKLLAEYENLFVKLLALLLTKFDTTTANEINEKITKFSHQNSLIVKGIAENLGFVVENEYEKKLAINPQDVAKIIISEKNDSNLGKLLSTNILIASVNNAHPFHSFNEEQKNQFITNVFNAKTNRNFAKHSGKSEYYWIERTLKDAENLVATMLELGNNVEVQKNINKINNNFKIAELEINSKLAEKIIDAKCKETISIMKKDFDTKDSNFYNACHNALVDIFALLTKKAINSCRVAYTDIEEQANAILSGKNPNERVVVLLKQNGSQYQFHTFPNLSAIRSGKHKLSNNSIRLEMYYFIVICDILESNMIKQVIEAVPDIFEISEKIAILRGHNNYCQFYEDDNDLALFAEKIEKYAVVATKL